MGLKLKCGCELQDANDPDAEITVGDGTQRQKLIFCDGHQAKMKEIIETNGGYCQVDPESGIIQAAELTVRALGAIEEFTQAVVFQGLEELGMLPEPPEPPSEDELNKLLDSLKPNKEEN